MASNKAVVIKIDGDTKQYKASVAEINKENKQVGVNAQKMALVASGAFAAVLTGVVKVTQAYGEQERIERKVAQTIKATGFAAGVTAQEMFDLASSMQDVTRFGDEAILSATNILLTFKNISKDVLPQTVEAMLNVSETMGTDLKSSAVQLGKALNDPKVGLTALTRVGITFTDQQKDQIKTLTESGRVLEAQKIILGELESQFGGAARAGAENTGVYDQLKNIFGDIAEVIGKRISPALISAAKYWKDVASSTKEAIDNSRGIGDAEADVIKYTNALAELNRKLLIARESPSEALSQGFSERSIQDQIKRITVLQVDAEIELQGYKEKIRKEQAAITKAANAKNVKAISDNELSQENDKAKKKIKIYIEAEEAKIKAKKALLKAEGDGADEIEKAQLQIDELAQIEEKGQLKKLEAEGKFSQALGKIEKKTTDEKKKEAEKRKLISDQTTAYQLQALTNFGALATQILGQDSKEAFAITQAAALASAIVNTAQGVTSALKIGPAGIPLATAIGVAGGLQVATIAAQTLQGFEGGGVIGGAFTGATAGGDNTTFKGRKGEVVLNADQQKRLFDIATGVQQPTSSVSDSNITLTIIPDEKRLFKVMQKQSINANASGVGKFIMKK